jgi:hypothetical protein
MKQQPDKLFRDKLFSHSKDVPPMLWDRIESGLEKKKSSFTWLFVAASITVAIAAGYLFQTGGIETNNKELAGVPSPIDSSTTESGIAVKDHLADGKIAIVEPTPTPVKRKSEGKKNITKTKENSLTVTHAEELILEEPVQPVLQDSVAHSYAATPQLAFRALAKREENITIVITAEQTNQYLVNNKISEATSDEKKSSTLKKLLKKAADLKVNQDPFGDLRQKKNEILALNFRSEKQRGQKK